MGRHRTYPEPGRVFHSLHIPRPPATPFHERIRPLTNIPDDNRDGSVVQTVGTGERVAGLSDKAGEGMESDTVGGSDKREWDCEDCVTRSFGQRGVD